MLIFHTHTLATEHPLRVGARLTISFNLNYYCGARRESRLCLILEIQLPSLQDSPMSGQNEFGSHKEM